MNLKIKLERYKFELEQAERDANYEDAGKLKYSIIPELEAKLKENAHDWQLGRKDIAQIIARQSGIPVQKILQDKELRILKLEEHLNKRVFGQKKALQAIAETLLTAYAGIKDPKRPLGSFLLKGGSGVGKTETAKAIAQFLFDSDSNIIRLDMSEYAERHSISKLVGSPPGYVGYEEGGHLTEAVRRRPYSVILLDEIEKAHPDFADILLQILDEGRLTDSKGRTVNFKNSIVILTTNSPNCEKSFKSGSLGSLGCHLGVSGVGP